MKLLSISDTTTLKELSDMVGYNNVTDVLVANGLTRSPNIGEQFAQKVQALKSVSTNIDYILDINVMIDRKCTLLKTFMDDTDIFERACLSSNQEWQVISALGTFSGYLKLPDVVAESIPSNASLLGNGVNVSKLLYSSVINSLLTTGDVDISLFNSYSGLSSSSLGAIAKTQALGNSAINTDFKIPFHDITLYSNLMDASMDIPVYPEELDDGVVANYDTMGNLLYQYEPWSLYSSSGPREVPFTFHLHRDMWTGDRNDGIANQLIRFCEANCYPNYQGACVNAPTVTLYVKGNNFITGVMTSCKKSWTGPLGDDGWYLDFRLSFTIREVSKIRLDMQTQRNKALIQ